MRLHWHYAAILCAAASGADLPRPVYRIEAVAGSANQGDGGPAAVAQIGNIQGVAADRFGNIFLSDTDHHRVRKITATGIITTLAGTGTAGYSGDGGLATAATLNLPYGLAADLAGYIYVADLGNQRVRRIAPDGTIDTVAGNGTKAAGADGGFAAQTPLMTPRNVAVDGAGNLFVSEFEGHRVRKVSPDGRISTVAGTGIAGFRGDGGAANSAQLGFPAGLAVDRFGMLYVADSMNNRIRRVTPGGPIATVVGGSPSTLLATPIAVALDAAGTIYVADSGFQVRAETAAGAWNAIVGKASQGYSGDGGPATKAELTQPRDVATDLNGNLLIADGVRIRRVDTKGPIATVAGDGFVHAVGDGLAASAGILALPNAVALDARGTLYIADTGTERVRAVTGGTITTLAGTGVAAAGTDGGPSQSSALNNPVGVAVDSFGNVVIADTFNHRIRQVANGRIATLVGTGAPGTGEEGVAPLKAQLRGPRAVCFDRAGVLYIADTSNHRVLRIATPGVMETVAGNGAPGDAGDGGQAHAAQLDQPGACALDSAGNLYIADTASDRVRKVTPAGIITTAAGTGTPGFSGDEAAATAASLSGPRGIAVDDNGDIFIADTGNHRIRQVTPDGLIHTIAGTGTAGFAGDDGAAADARLNAPGGLVLDGAGNLYFADTGNNRVRRLAPQAVAPPAPILQGPPLTTVNAASLRQGPVAPGELITLFGTGLGPEAGVPAAQDASGLYANLLAGTEVRFDGVPAPLLYVQASQVNAQAPYTLTDGAASHVAVLRDGQEVAAVDLQSTASAPALFPVVQNQDGLLNNESNPASRGTLFTIYGTGEGLTDGANIAGQVSQPPYARPRLPVTVTVAGIAAEVVFAGSAPGTVGTLQVNARVPGGFVPPGPVSVQLQVGAAVSNFLTLWVK